MRFFRHLLARKFKSLSDSMKTSCPVCGQPATDGKDASTTSSAKLSRAGIKKPRVESSEKRKKERISIWLDIWLDRDVVDHFRYTGRDWQPRINSILRSHIGK